MQRFAKDATGLAEMITRSGTITNNGTKIRDKAERLKQDLEKVKKHLNVPMANQAYSRLR